MWASKCYFFLTLTLETNAAVLEKIYLLFALIDKEGWNCFLAIRTLICGFVEGNTHRRFSSHLS